MARSAITKSQARARARERMGQRLAREAAFLEHAAAWELAHDAMCVALGAMYDAGFTRAEIADRLGIPTSRVVKPEELDVADGVDDRGESAEQADVSDEQAAGDDESRADDVAATSGDDSGDH